MKEHTELGLTEQVALLGAIQSDDARARRAAYFELLRRESGADAILLTSINPGSGEHQVVACVDYTESTARFIATDLVVNDPTAKRVILDTTPSLVYSWENLEGYVDSRPAVEYFLPDGFNNGITLPLRDSRNRLIGTCNLSIAKPAFNGSTKRLLGALRPSLAKIAGRAQERTLAALSARESEVLNLIKIGMTDVEVAELLFISPRTVTTHMEHIRKKLKASSRAEALYRAMRMELL